MKLTKDDPRITAYAFGELSPQEMRDVARELAHNPERKQEVEELVALEHLFDKGSEKQLKLHPHQKAAIYQSSDEPTNVVHIPKRSWSKGAVALVAAAAVVVVSLFVLQNSGGRSQQGNQAVADLRGWEDSDYFARSQVNPSPYQIIGDVVVGQMQGKIETIRTNGAEVRNAVSQRFASATDVALEQLKSNEDPFVVLGKDVVHRVPLFANNFSFGYLENALNNEMPYSSDLLREEEIINALPTSLPEDLIVRGVQAGIDLIECPWNESILLVVVRVKATKDKQLVNAGVQFTENIEQSYIVGYNTCESNVLSPNNMLFNQGDATTVIYAVKLASGLSEEDEVAVLHLDATADGRTSRSSLSLLNSKHEFENTSSNLKAPIQALAWVESMKSGDERLVQFVEEEVLQSNDLPEKWLELIRKSSNYRAVNSNGTR